MYARIVVGYLPSLQKPYGHMAIHPYPKHYETHWQLGDGTDVFNRPIRPEDADIEQQFIRELSDQSLYFRFIHGLKKLSPEMLARFTQIDFDREMALIAVISGHGEAKEVDVSRYVTNPDGQSCEFAVVDDWQQTELGYKLMELLISAARARGLIRMVGTVLRANHNMLELSETLGFSSSDDPLDPELKCPEKDLA